MGPGAKLIVPSHFLSFIGALLLRVATFHWELGFTGITGTRRFLGQNPWEHWDLHFSMRKSWESLGFKVFAEIFKTIFFKKLYI